MLDRATALVLGEADINSTEELLKRSFTQSEKQQQFIRQKVRQFSAQHGLTMMHALNACAYGFVLLSAMKGLNASSLMGVSFAGLSYPVAAIVVIGPLSTAINEAKKHYAEHHALLEELIQIAKWCSKDLKEGVLKYDSFREVCEALQPYVLEKEVEYMAEMLKAANTKLISNNQMYLFFGYKAQPLKAALIKAKDLVPDSAMMLVSNVASVGRRMSK